MNRLAFVCFTLFFLGVAIYADDSGQKLAFQQSAAGGDAEAQYQLAFLYEEEAMADGDISEPAPVPWEKAIHWYEASAAQGHKQAQYALLSRMYSSEGEEEMGKWLKLANTMAEGGDKYAQYRLGGYYFSKCVGSRMYDGDPFPDAIRWYTELLVGTEAQGDDEDILPRSLALSKNATIGDIRFRLNYLKELTR